MKYEIKQVPKYETALDAYPDVEVQLTVNGLQAAFLKIMVERTSDAKMKELLNHDTSIRGGELLDMLNEGNGLVMGKIMDVHSWAPMIGAIDLEARNLMEKDK